MNEQEHAELRETIHRLRHERDEARDEALHLRRAIDKSLAETNADKADRILRTVVQEMNAKAEGVRL